MRFMPSLSISVSMKIGGALTSYADDDLRERIRRRYHGW
ncbi:hypothetical protein ACZ87_01471 [Candidatus Erwinia dacicola]|uniref:Uncharacterized protein n=1 Tax=Candidatus Erwinia dacicola TaxID=252393 RepID=A0A2T6MNF4_9GAMM|nr:hypothetical protein ACZ87_01492 [Candidatus Erwinia dacicola]RAP71697.1 hypothetical protein ACZ87_01471 [Candidatus Erwinia dacicola]